MGAAFGLLSLLITVAIILWMMVGTGYTGAVAKQNQAARQQLNVLSGKDPTGTVSAIDTIHTRVDRTGARPRFIATEVQQGGVMEERYGIRPGDRIVEIAGLDFETNIGSKESGDEWLATAYARQQSIVVMRGNQKLTLPTPEHVRAIAERDRQAKLAAAQANITAPPPPAPTPAKGEDLSPIQKALDKIRSTPGQ